MRVKSDWVPFSAAMLLTGALALALGTILIPSADDTAETVRSVHEQNGQWMAGAATYFVSAVFLTLGLPTALSMLPRRGRTLGLVSAVSLELGFIGTAGYAMLLVFFSALVRTGTLVHQDLGEVANDAGLLIFIYGWIVGFVVGELLLGIALLRAGTVPRWVGLAFLAHVATVPLSAVLPSAVSKATILLFVAGAAGIAIAATASPLAPRRPS